MLPALGRLSLETDARVVTTVPPDPPDPPDPRDAPSVGKRRRARDGGHTCAICTEEVTPDQDGVYLYCGDNELPHAYHSTCLRNWRMRKGPRFHCPVCRTQVVESAWYVWVVDGRTVRRADRLTAVVDPLNKVTPWLVDRYPAIGRTNEDIRAAVEDCRSNGYRHELYGPIEYWDVSNVEDMTGVFADDQEFNRDIGGWDVRNVRSMRNMFREAFAFNQDLSAWNVENVRSMGSMFEAARSFDSPLFTVTKQGRLELASRMFKDALRFDQDLSNWDLSEVWDFSSMFQNAKRFSGYSSTSRMFRIGVPTELADYDGETRPMSKMFMGCSAFNADLSSWDVRTVTDMSQMFEGCKKLNSPMFAMHPGESACRTTTAMFRGATAFKQDLSEWALGHVCNLSFMFEDATSVEMTPNVLHEDDAIYMVNMEGMFKGARAFSDKEGLRYWRLLHVWNMEGMFDGVPGFAWNGELSTDSKPYYFQNSEFDSLDRRDNVFDQTTAS
mgnify:CR=1 FL=1